MRHSLQQTQVADHPLSRYDARVKLLAVLALLTMVLSYRGAAFPLLLSALSVALCLSLKVRPRLLMLRFAQPLFFAAVIVLLKLFTTGAVPLFTLSVWGINLIGYSDGLGEGLLIAGRIVGAVSLVALLGFSTSFTDLISALAWFRVPQGLIEVALFAWRYLFVLFEDAMVIYNAQKNRLGYAGYPQGLRSFGTLAGAMVIKAFDNSQTITTAMVQRGYDGTLPPIRQQPFRGREVAATLLVVAVLGVIWNV
ncbi:cobalt ECF transporter T component CbiQ [Geotalea toluenoxydans]|uniref:cobalt ECF transporter T component CbiQ n=1 Tax=Geotalea toluenoxydans TaxID=421624 RepID=UPI0006D1DA3A|nr:cobalt ECF transporter T component CbiQ [Geotalea toluenoxydans]